MKKAIEKQYLIIYLSPILKYMGVIFSVLGLIGVGIISYLLLQSDLNWSTYEFPLPENPSYGQLNLWLPYALPGGMGVLFLLIGSIILLRYFLKRSKILKTISQSTPESAVVVSNIQNFHVRMNSVPRREVIFSTKDGSIYVFKFFSEHLATLFKEGVEVPIITDGKKAYPAPEFFGEMLKM